MATTASVSFCSVVLFAQCSALVPKPELLPACLPVSLLGPIPWAPSLLTLFTLESIHMHRPFVLLPGLLALCLIGCGRPEPPPPSPQLAEVIKERDRERAARNEAEAARQKGESHNTSLMFGAALACTVALFAGIALGSSARRRSSPSTGLQIGQAGD